MRSKVVAKPYQFWYSESFSDEFSEFTDFIRIHDSVIAPHSPLQERIKPKNSIRMLTRLAITGC
ncbi:MAG: hypothetical protein VXX55_06335 [Planctomycetota bacterium]|nr:hypothetical protein [Planctomycetota bacterium]MEC8800359.1 hypothetical protein [Planctomycetota bacterium]